MVRNRFRLLAFALVPVLMAEAMFVGAMHSSCHLGHARHDREAYAHECGALDDSRAPKADPDSPSEDPSTPGPWPIHHDKSQCLACQYLAKQSLPAVLAAAPCLVSTTEFVESPDLIRERSSQLSLPHCRAPPAVL